MKLSSELKPGDLIYFKIDATPHSYELRHMASRAVKCKPKEIFLILEDVTADEWYIKVLAPQGIRFIHVVWFDHMCCFSEAKTAYERK